ncbi:10798_t:CDS:2 [Acaulospora morrowiae]|uniref:10798_t:CDS:1 n=1 Tax=Acaulospora morrowiae TaxID=94023 RepID=A0A9N9ETE1_9GLOM|nr:10798_t:CDS:2 [Acaulospora morrowiae]
MSSPIIPPSVFIEYMQIKEVWLTKQFGKWSHPDADSITSLTPFALSSEILTIPQLLSFISKILIWNVSSPGGLHSRSMSFPDGSGQLFYTTIGTQ